METVTVNAGTLAVRLAWGTTTATDLLAQLLAYRGGRFRDAVVRSGVLHGEGESDLCDLWPAVVEDERVATTGNLLEFGDAGVALLLPVRGSGDRVRRDVILLSCDQRPGSGCRPPL